MLRLVGKTYGSVGYIPNFYWYIPLGCGDTPCSMRSHPNLLVKVHALVESFLVKCIFVMCISAKFYVIPVIPGPLWFHRSLLKLFARQHSIVIRVHRFKKLLHLNRKPPIGDIPTIMGIETSNETPIKPLFDHKKKTPHMWIHTKRMRCRKRGWSGRQIYVFPEYIDPVVWKHQKSHGL